MAKKWLSYNDRGIIKKIEFICFAALFSFPRALR